MKKLLYAAYGTDLCQRRMRYRCPTAKAIAKSWLHDYRLTFSGRPTGSHATVIPSEGDAVPLVVWEITEEDAANLDRYYGVGNGSGIREYVEIEVDGKMESALIYNLTNSGYGVPTDYHLQELVEGYKEFNLDINILNDAVIRAYQESTEKEENP